MSEGKRPDNRRGKRKHASPGASIPFFFVLGLVTILAWCLPLRQSVSQKEKRELEAFPTFSLRSIGDGSYFEQIGLWFSDTLTGRDS